MHTIVACLPTHLTGLRALNNLLDGPLENGAQVRACSELHELIHEHGGESAGPEQGAHVLCVWCGVCVCVCGGGGYIVNGMWPGVRDS